VGRESRVLGGWERWFAVDRSGQGLVPTRIRRFSPGGVFVGRAGRRGGLLRRLGGAVRLAIRGGRPLAVPPAPVGPALIGLALVGLALVGPALIGLALIGPALVGLALIGPALVGLALIGLALVGLALVGLALVGPALIGLALVDAFGSVEVRPRGAGGTTRGHPLRMANPRSPRQLT
jgi:hypothetical protein